MRIRSLVRRVAVTAAAGALTATTLAVTSAPAQAAPVVNTVTVSATLSLYSNAGYSTAVRGYYGDYTNDRVDVTATTQTGARAYPSVGTWTLWEMPAGGSWTPLEYDVDTSAPYFSALSSLKYNAAYKVTYSGGTKVTGSGNYSTTNTYLPTETAVATTSVARKVTASGRGRNGRIPVKVKVSPAAKVKLKVQAKVGGKWRTQINKKTNKKGVLKGIVRGRTGTKVRIIAKGDTRYVSTRWQSKIV